MSFKDEYRTVHLTKPVIGLKRDKHDERDYISKGATTNSFFNLEEYSSIIKNQGRMSSCSAHAAILVYEMERRIAEKKWQIDGSEQHNYYYGRILSKMFPEDGGAYLRDACKTMFKYGVCPEQLHHYTDGMPNIKPGIFSNSFARLFKIKGYYRLKDIDSIKYSISHMHPVLLGIPLYKGFRETKLTIPLPEGSSSGGHAITVLGFDDSRKSFIIQNSWDKDWGFSGKAWLPYKYLEEARWFDSWNIRI